METILIAEDDPEVRSTLRRALDAERWRTLKCTSWHDLEALLGAEPIDITLVASSLVPDDPAAIGRLRDQFGVPCIILKETMDPGKRLGWLEAGADDYIIKPFHPREVILRIRYALLGRLARHGIAVTFDHHEFDLRHKVVRRLDGTVVDLTGAELQLLELFVFRPGQILSRDDLSHLLHHRDWRYDDRSIDGQVSRLRHKLWTSDHPSSLISSVRGKGYVFTGEVTIASDV